MADLPLEVTPRDVKQLLDSGQPVKLLDVREPQEYQMSSIAGAELLPMRSVPAQLTRLESEADQATLIVFCHHGMRSLNVVDWLRRNGLENCQSMAGGIDRWSLEIDPQVPRYF